MLLAVDIGNTNIVLALHDGSSWVNSWRVYSDAKKTGDEYYVIFHSLLQEWSEKKMVERIILSSVVPNLTLSVHKNLRRLFGQEVLVVDHNVECGLVRESIPEELGSDLLCNLAYAHHLRPEDYVMTIDFGTALTFSTVSPQGCVKGVAIAPGLLTGLNALCGATAQLPQVELRTPSSAMGRNSEDSIRAGLMYGYAGLARSLIERTEEELGSRLYVIATGGLSKTICPLIERIDLVDKNHTLNGLRLIAELNVQHKDTVFKDHNILL